jgi:hypothetical protein
MALKTTSVGKAIANFLFGELLLILFTLIALDSVPKGLSKFSEAPFHVYFPFFGLPALFLFRFCFRPFRSTKGYRIWGHLILGIPALIQLWLWIVGCGLSGNAFPLVEAVLTSAVSLLTTWWVLR